MKIKMKVLVIAIVIGLAITGATYFADVTYDKSIQHIFYDVSDGSLNFVVFNATGQTDTDLGLLFTFLSISSERAIFSPLAFIIDFFIFFAICFAIVFFLETTSEKRKVAYHMRMQQLHYSRRKIRRR